MMMIQGKITNYSCVQTHGSDCVFNVTVLYEKVKYIFSIGDLNYMRIVNCIQCDKITLRTNSKTLNLPPKLNSAILCNNDAYIESGEPSGEKANSIVTIFETFENSLQKIKDTILTGTVRPSQRKRRKPSSSTESSDDDVEFLNSDSEEKAVNPQPGLFNQKWCQPDN